MDWETAQWMERCGRSLRTSASSLSIHVQPWHPHRYLSPALHEVVSEGSQALQAASNANSKERPCLREIKSAVIVYNKWDRQEPSRRDSSLHGALENKENLEKSTQILFHLKTDRQQINTSDS